MTNQDRRQMMAALGSLVAGSIWPGHGAAAATAGATGSVARAPLSGGSIPVRTEYDVVVVGSGYGGAVMAARLAAGRKLCVLERGREWSPASFPASHSQLLGQFRSANAPLGLFDYRIGSTLDVLAGNGLGGTSLINANVVLAAEREVIARWHSHLARDVASGAFAGFEARVQQMLAVDMVREADGLRKNWLHRSNTQMRARQGAAVQNTGLPLAVNLRRYQQQPNAQGVLQNPCSHCGDCVTGCRVGAKNTLDVNYLPAARAAGAEMYTRIEVEWLERLADGRWRVHYLARPDGASPVRGSLIAASVVLSAGSLGSTQILLRSQAQGLALAPTLGSRFSGNGDVLGFGYNCAIQTNVSGFGQKTAPHNIPRVGPTITHAADYRANPVPANRFLIEEGALPSALVDVLRLGLPLAAGVMSEFGAASRIARDLIGPKSDGALNHSMLYLGIGHDSASGKIVLDAAGNAKVVWPNLLQEPFINRVKAEMAQHAASFGGKMVDSPRNSPIFGGALTTVHPLGGCPMAESVDAGVVNADGGVFHPNGGVYAGLRVVDGAMLPGSVGANPLLTIAALAERAAANFR